MADSSRRLTPVGVSHVKRLMDSIEPVDAVFCSPYARAQQTAELILPALDIEVIQFYNGLTPDSSVQALQLWLESLNYQKVLLVAHNPLLSQLASQLTARPGGVALGTANLACLEVLDWMPGGADLVYVN